MFFYDLRVFLKIFNFIIVCEIICVFLQQFFCEMTDDNGQNIIIFDNFDKKLKALIAQNQELKDKNSLLNIQTDVERNKLRIAHKEYVDLQEEYRNFRLSEYLSAKGDGAVKAEFRQTIEGLVRKIDTCLELLND